MRTPHAVSPPGRSVPGLRGGPGRPSRRTVAISAAVMLAIAGIVVAALVSGETGGSGTAPAPGGSGAPLAGESSKPEDELLALLPSTTTRCRPFEAAVGGWYDGAAASVKCRVDGERVYFHLFETRSELARAYRQSLSGFPVDPEEPTCVDGSYDGLWFRDDAPAGRAQCYVTTNDLAGIEWTDRSSLVYGVLEGRDDDLSVLTSAWTTLNPDGVMEEKTEVSLDDEDVPLTDDPATETYAEYAAIRTDINTEVGAIAGTSISYVRFVARDEDGAGEIVARAPGSDSLDDEEFVTLPETSERRALVDELRAELEADGWVEIGLMEGGEWFEYRYGR